MSAEKQTVMQEAQPAKKRFETVKEWAATRRVNVKTAYEAAKRGEIPGAIRVGKSIRIAIDA